MTSIYRFSVEHFRKNTNTSSAHKQRNKSLTNNQAQRQWRHHRGTHWDRTTWSWQDNSDGCWWAGWSLICPTFSDADQLMYSTVTLSTWKHNAVSMSHTVMAGTRDRTDIMEAHSNMLEHLHGFPEKDRNNTDIRRRLGGCGCCTSCSSLKYRHTILNQTAWLDTCHVQWVTLCFLFCLMDNNWNAINAPNVFPAADDSCILMSVLWSFIWRLFSIQDTVISSSYYRAFSIWRGCLIIWQAIEMTPIEGCRNES